MRPLQTKPGYSAPLINEIAAIGLGCILTSSDISSEDKGLIRKELARFEKLEVIYKQNTADELNIVVPEFPEFDDQMRKLQPLSKEEMRQIAGGEIFLTPGIISTITGVLATIGGTMLSVGTVATLANGVVVGSVSAVAAGVAALGLVAGTAFGAAAVVATGIGVGIAGAMGAFDGNQAVSIGHSS